MYPYQIDEETIIATGVVLALFAAIYIYRKIIAAGSQVVKLMEDAHETSCSLCKEGECRDCTIDELISKL